MRPFHDFAQAWPRLCCAGASACLALTSLNPVRAGESREAGRPYLRYYAPGEHLRGTASYRVTQDASGLIYFATPRDILKYDGFRWHVTDLPPDAASVRRFMAVADNRLYLVGAGVIGYVSAPGWENRFESLASEALSSDARGLIEFRDGAALGAEVFFADEERILRWRHDKFTSFPFPTPPGSHGPRFHRVGDTLYFSALSRGLWRWDANGPQLVSDDPVLRESRIVSLEAGADGALIFLTAERGVHELGVDGRVTPRATEMNRFLAGKRVYAAIRLPDGSRAISFSATSGEGGARFAPDGSYAGPLDSSIGLFINSVRDFFRDREGGLWLGLTVGTARLEWPSAASFFDASNGLSSGAVAQIVRHRDVLYAATSEGLFKLVPADGQGRMAHFERLSNQEFLGLEVVGDELVALTRNALFALNADRVRVVLRFSADATKLTASRLGPARVWLATTQGIRAAQRTACGWVDNGRVSDLSDACHDVREAADGAVWAALASGGLVRIGSDQASDFSSARAQRFSAQDGFGARTEFITRGANELLFATVGARELRAYDALAGKFVTRQTLAKTFHGGAFASGPANSLWHAHETRVTLQSASDPAVTVLPQFVAAAIGGATGVFAENDPDAPVLWLAGASGLARIDLSTAFPAPAPYAVQLEAEGVQPGEELPTEPGPVKFRFGAPRLGPLQRVEYRTRLAGRESAWTAWNEQRERSFPELRPGRFTFEVEARDADGVLASPAVFEFSVHTPWWQTRWAYGGYTLIAFAGIAGIVQLRTRTLRRHTARLAAVVEQRTAELARKNEELVRLHQLEFDEKVSARLAEEKARLEMLRYQLNPHFLFNTLVSVSASLPAGASTARGMVERLSEFCRLTLHRRDEREWTTLEEEMKLLGAYLAIEQARWGDLLTISLRCDAGLEHEQLPHFLLLPLVENALKYGRATSPDHVAIRVQAVRADDGALLLTVSNTGDWIEPGNEKSVASLGIGLENLRERLSRHYPRRHELAITHGTGWVTVTLRLHRPQAI